MTGIAFRRLTAGLFLVMGMAGLVWGQTSPDGSSAQRVALLAAVEGPIGPATLRHVERVVDIAREREAAVLILRLDTPGGLATSMREVISAILASTVPVAGYVAPSGAHAASAGTYILYATHIAAMAPGTNLGAATPVQIGGGGLPGLPSDPPRENGETEKGSESGDTGQGSESGDKGPKDPAPAGGTMSRKAVNDAVAFIRSLAHMHGRNAEWAEEAVREAASLSAIEARDRNVVDIVAPDTAALLDAMDGRTVTAGGREVTLATRDLTVEHIDQDFVTEALSILTNPNVAMILMLIGVYGIIFEFINPGSIGPGVAGAICLVLGLYSLNQLPLNYAGLALVILGIVFMLAEAFTPTFGVLGAGGLAAFVIGAAMLVDTDVPAFQLSWWMIGIMGALSAAFLIFIVGYMWKVYRRPGRRDAPKMVGVEGEVLDWAGGEGHVWAHGERWSARGAVAESGSGAIRVVDMDGLTLIVEPVDKDGAAAGTSNEGALPNKGD
ncbi:MAG: nodulation protein NfeD [Alphaproteobacteria bacterium]